MSPDAINRHLQERADEQESSFTPRRLLVFAWVMLPLLLYVLYLFARKYIAYHLGHDLAPAPDALDTPTPGGS